MVALAAPARFVYHQNVNVERHDATASRIAAAIGVPARARMLFCLSDGRARTSTELALVGGITPSTASIHLKRLMGQRLVKVFAQGKHHYYSLEGPQVAAALEALSVLAGGAGAPFEPNTPHPLRAGRTCYDHIAGALGVALHDRITALGWLAGPAAAAYDVTAAGAKGFGRLGIDVESARSLRRRFAFACIDWSERRPHLGGALGAALLAQALGRKWVKPDRHSRALAVTTAGRRELRSMLGLTLPGS
jgi:DNA-binding transcriptional ArsR family regulator